MGSVNQMVNYLGMICAFFITFPFLPTILVYKISEKIVRNKLRAFHISINWTTILYILATITILNNLFEKQFIGIILGLILFILAIIIIWQWKTRTEVLFNRAIKILWRLCFLIFVSTYTIMVVYGIIIRIIF